MSSFIELNDIDGTVRFVNIKKIAYIEPVEDNCRVVMTIKGRGEYPHFAFLTKQTYDEVMRLIIDSDE